MKKKIAKVITVTFLISILLSAFPVNIFAASAQKVVVINPGHSVGHETGAVGKVTTEAQLNQRLAGAVVRLLNQQGYKAYITHTTDSDLQSQKLMENGTAATLRNIAGPVNALSPDLVLSIHHNSGGNSASGFELYWSSYRSYDNSGVYTVPNMWPSGSGAYRDSTPTFEAQESERLANIIKNNLDGQPYIPFRKIVERDDYLPAHAAAPCVLYEGGFISNPSEEAYLNSDAYMNEASTRLVRAISEYFNSPIDDSAWITVRTPIMGDSGTTAADLVNFYKNSGNSFPSYYTSHGVNLDQFAQMYVDETKAEGVRTDLAFAQTMLETGYLKFGGDVQISQFNFAGIGATGNGAPGEDFANKYGSNANGVRMGIRAQIQHLKAYGSTESLKNECVDPRFQYVNRGCASSIGDLSGKWAADTNYATKIVTIMKKIPSSGGSSAGTGIPVIEDDSDENSSSIYRLFNLTSGEHLYTIDQEEVRVLTNGRGWRYEGIGWYSPNTGVGVYRLFNPNISDHLYTTDLNEVKTLTSNNNGWVLDFNGEPIFYSGGDVPVYRLYDKGVKGMHLLTTDSNEYSVLNDRGWSQEGIALKAYKLGK